ncbi:MAG: hypothetical protein PHQ40_14395 [Anaerolineaceae bacterium]|nr:hypothetical protein [Anaerolineaceae bacterium]
MFNKIGRMFGRKSTTAIAQRQPGIPRLGSAGTMLDVYLSAMPGATQLQQKARFAAVAANFEFGVFISMQAAEQLAGEAIQKGFTVWGNIDATSAFLYGAGVVGQDDFPPVMAWLRNIATTGQKIQVGIHNPGEPIKLIEIAV